MGLKYPSSRSLRLKLSILLICPISIEATTNITGSEGEKGLWDGWRTGVNEWHHVGCVSDIEGEETALHVDDIEGHCKAHCWNKQSKYAGVQNNLCRCGNPAAGRLYENKNQCHKMHWKFFALTGKNIS